VTLEDVLYGSISYRYTDEGGGAQQTAQATSQ